MKDKDVLVKVEGLSKKFCKDLKTSLWYGLKDLFGNIGGNQGERKLRDKEFWALKDINFELRRGECLGLIGHNGAGKSTLLKILNGLLKPDAGKVTIQGRVGALIELGAGFNPLLTGRENIFNNGAVLGFSRQEITDKLEDIIDFAEIREFIDMPVRNYSSGMKVRLGFAVAAQMEPDVLIIDEVLAVGDLGFRLKCYRTIDDILPRTAIIFVSHSMPQVSRLCDKIILLDSGKMNYEGNEIAKAVDKYYSRFSNNGENIIFDDGSFEVESAELLKMDDMSKEGIPQIKWNQPLKMHFKVKVKRPTKSPRFSITIYDKEQRPVAILDKNNDEMSVPIKNGVIDFIVTHDKIQLSKGLYSINLAIINRDSPGPFLRYNNILSFQIMHDEDVWEPMLLQSSFRSSE